jgi:hypothetical protein
MKTESNSARVLPWDETSIVEYLAGTSNSINRTVSLNRAHEEAFLDSLCETYYFA